MTGEALTPEQLAEFVDLGHANSARVAAELKRFRQRLEAEVAAVLEQYVIPPGEELDAFVRYVAAELGVEVDAVEVTEDPDHPGHYTGHVRLPPATTLVDLTIVRTDPLTEEPPCPPPS